MRIHHLAPNAESCAGCIGDLERLIAQPTAAQRRPCRGCRIRCPCGKSTTCTHACSPACAHAPRMLPSDPEHHPIEPGIVALVFALRSLRVFEPCWSCEGHNGAGGRLGKLPRVWFYCRSLVYPRLLWEYLGELRRRKALAVHWQVCLTFSAVDNADTAFSVEPALGPAEAPPLSALRADAATIAAELADAIRKCAASQLAVHRRSRSSLARPPA